MILSFRHFKKNILLRSEDCSIDPPFAEYIKRRTDSYLDFFSDMPMSKQQLLVSTQAISNRVLSWFADNLSKINIQITIIESTISMDIAGLLNRIMKYSIDGFFTVIIHSF